MKIVENNVKCGEVMIFDDKFYSKNYELSFKFCLYGRDFLKNFCQKAHLFPDTYYADITLTSDTSPPPLANSAASFPLPWGEAFNLSRRASVRCPDD